ncbi:MAG: MFS transporter [Deltaproteobacteria bacterium]|nr:MFS transporter [Deltaproteobacteria bacterium]
MSRPGFFYGHVIVAACASVQAVAIGSYVAFGVFFGPVAAEFGWSRATLSGAHALAILVAGVLGVVVGRASDRVGPRIPMSLAGFVCGLGLLLLSRMTAPWQLYLFYGLIFGVGLSAADIIALSTTARWFIRRRGLMTGLVKMGTGSGQLVIPLVIGMLIPAFGWRTSYVILGLAVLVALVGVAQLLRRDPAQLGLLPDGDAVIGPARTARGESGAFSREALGTRQFWTIFFANLAAVFTFGSIMLHIVPHATDVGVPPRAAAGVLSVIGGVSLVGRFVIGRAVDWIGPRRCMILCFVLLIAVLLWLQVARELWMLYSFAAAYGLAHGGFYTAISPLIAEYFGLRAHGFLLGIAVLAGNIGGFIGPIFAGYVFDVAASYRLAFGVFAGTSALGLALIVSLRPAVVEGARDYLRRPVPGMSGSEGGGD